MTEILQKQRAESLAEMKKLLAPIEKQVGDLQIRIDRLEMRQLCAVLEERILMSMGPTWREYKLKDADDAYRYLCGIPHRGSYCMIEEHGKIFEACLRKAFGASIDVVKCSSALVRNIAWAKRLAFPIAHNKELTEEQLIEIINKVVISEDDKLVCIEMIHAAEILKPPGKKLMELLRRDE
jgi:hypothetical protein